MSKKIDNLQELDDWLGSGFVNPPADFTDRVMRRAQALPLPARKPQVKNTLHELVKWLLLLGGAALGAAELVMFIFGIWLASAAA